jgi:hypothetical protein
MHSAARPTATQGTARMCGAGMAQLGRPAQRTGAWETVGNGGSPARRRQRGVTATGERRARRSGRHGDGLGDGAVSEAVGATVARTRRSGGRREARSEGGRCERGRLSGRAARCPDSGFKPRHRRGTWQRRGNGALPCRPGAACGV